MTWLHYLKDCAEINNMLNASIKSLATIHYSLSHAPAPHDGADHSRVKQVLFQIRMRAGRPRSQAMHDDTDHTGRNRGVSGKAAVRFL